MGKIAFVFPGQGAQSVGMGYDAYNENEAAKNIYDTFNTILGRNLTKVCFEGPDEDLKLTTNTQPAILATSIALLEALKSKTELKADFVAGHSLGEYAALYEAGVLSLDDTIKAINKRAELMGKSKGGTMAAVLGLADEQVKTVLDETMRSYVAVGKDLKAVTEKAAKGIYVDVANYNCPGQVVITGSEEGVAEATKLLTEAGAKRVIPLAVSGAFHSEMMKDAGFAFAEFLSEVEINNAKTPVITNVDAEETTSGADFEDKMSKQIYSSVYWTQTVQNLKEKGVDTIFEVGPGKVLAGLIKKIEPSIKVVNICDMKSLNSYVESLQEV